VFTLAKWYLDVVADDGTVAVGYAGRLSFAGVRLTYASMLLSMPGAPAREDSTFDSARDPHLENDGAEAGAILTWHHPALGVGGRWRRHAAPIEQRLLQSADGDISWRCEMPRACVELDAGGRRIMGVGYAEHLTLTLAPWRLPFSQLRWGRFASATGSVIWIAWQGGETRQFVWHDGVLQTGAVIDARAIYGLAGGSTLHLDEPRDLCDRPAIARLAGRLPEPLRRAAGPITAMVEHKMVAPSRLVAPGGRPDSGWSVFEEVRW
jgi:hypothetical protein